MNRDRDRLQQLSALLEEVVEDNTAVVAELRGVGADVAALRGDLGGALAFRALKDLCEELVGPLTAMEAMLAGGDLDDPAIVAGHLRSLTVTLRGVLRRMGAEQVPVVPGVDRYDPAVHRCVGVVAPADSPFPGAAPHTVVRVVEEGYTLQHRPLTPVRVEIQAPATARQ